MQLLYIKMWRFLIEDSFQEVWISTSLNVGHYWNIDLDVVCNSNTCLWADCTGIFFLPKCDPQSSNTGISWDAVQNTECSLCFITTESVFALQWASWVITIYIKVWKNLLYPIHQANLPGTMSHSPHCHRNSVYTAAFSQKSYSNYTSSIFVCLKKL